MNNRLFRLAVLLCAVLVISTGCEGIKNAFRRTPQPPPLLPQSSNTLTLEQIITAINRNSMSIRSISTEDATMMVPGVLFQLRSRIMFERPKQLRIQSGIGLTGQELDFGSNDSMFWLWVRRLPNEMYYCRHDQFAACPMRSLVPIDPDWIIEALGIVEFSPSDRHEGPFKADDGSLMIVSRRQTQTGVFTKKTFIDAKNGWVLRQEMYNPQQELTAMAVSSNHTFDAATGIIYARQVEVQCQGAEGKMTLDLGNVKFNSQTAFSSTMFQMPVFDGYKAVDINSPEFLQNRGVIIQPLAPSASTPSMPVSSAAIPYSPVPLSTAVPYSVAEAHIQTVVK
ncbi:MAG: hypothetical protein FWE67_05665 [Planctomycetaceae bacterium]|nr:hypothetical protein [Planctomycetaceae bacterium]